MKIEIGTVAAVMKHLKLDSWTKLTKHSRRRVRRWNREQLIAKRTYVLLAAEWPGEPINIPNHNQSTFAELK